MPKASTTFTTSYCSNSTLPKTNPVTWKREQAFGMWLMLSQLHKVLFKNANAFLIYIMQVAVKQFSSPVHQFELQSWAQFVRCVRGNMPCHAQGSCPLFVLTLTSSDPEAPRKYSLAIFSNPHIHSLWLCWETHSVRAPSNLNWFISRTFVSQLQAYGAVFQSPSSHELSSSLTAVVQLLLYAADSQRAAIQEHRVTRQTQFTGAWKH